MATKIESKAAPPGCFFGIAGVISGVFAIGGFQSGSTGIALVCAVVCVLSIAACFAPKTPPTTGKCPVCESEYEVSSDIPGFDCPVCKKRLVVKEGRLLVVEGTKLEGPGPKP